MSVKLCVCLRHHVTPLSMPCHVWHLVRSPCNCDNVNALISLSYILSGHAVKRLAILIDLYLFYSFDVFSVYYVFFPIFNFSTPPFMLCFFSSIFIRLCVYFWMNINSCRFFSYGGRQSSLSHCRRVYRCHRHNIRISDTEMWRRKFCVFLSAFVCIVFDLECGALQLSIIGKLFP